MYPHLTSWRVNLSLLQETSSKELLMCIEKYEGNKIIVWDDALSGPVGLITQLSLLKERNVIKNLPLRSGQLQQIDVKNIIFITRPNLKLMDFISENILNDQSNNVNNKKMKNSKKDYHLIFWPRRSYLCEKHLKIKGVYGSFTNIDEIKCDFFPIDNDLISMECPLVHKELIIDGDPTCLYQAACGLIKLQKLYGRISKIYGKGDYAYKVWELTKSMGIEEKIMNQTDKGLIDQIIILDRSIDLMSALVTQLTYEGLIDEIYGINQTTVKFPLEQFTSSSSNVGGTGNVDENNFQTINNDMKTLILNSNEELYVELRNKNFNEVGKILSKHAKLISSTLDERHNEKSVQEMKKFVENLPIMLAKKQSLANHTKIAELLKDITDSNEFLDNLAAEQEFMICADIDKPSSYIEDLISKKSDFRTVIRLICIQCIASSGFKQKVLDYYKREIVQVYGTEALLTLSNLERAGFIKLQSETRSYAVLRKTLNLTVDDVVEISPKDISYVHSFYAPLTARIVEQSLKPLGWQSLKSVLNILPGQTFEDFQAPLIGIGGRRNSITSELSQNDIPRIILVFFIGGCTFAEISALRFLSQQDDNNVEFIIATTKLINKNTFLDNFIEKIS